MTKFFLSSHGHLASGLASSLDILLGGHDKVTVFDACLLYTSHQNCGDTEGQHSPGMERPGQAG